MLNGRSFLAITIIAFIIPQVTFAAWWNPFTWKIFNRADTIQNKIEVPKTVPVSEIEKLKTEIEELKKKTSIPAPTQHRPQVFSNPHMILKSESL